MTVALWQRSLRFRLLLATLAGLLVALSLSGVFLAEQFREHVMRQFAAALTAQLDQVTARLDFDAGGQAQMDTTGLSDPRWSRPYSGLYWQIDGPGAAAAQRGVLRSRSLWDSVLTLPADLPGDGAVQQHQATGPAGAHLLVVERLLRHDGDNWRVLVAGDLGPTAAAVAAFNGTLAVALLVLLGLLCLAALAQVALALAPLRALRRALLDIHEGRARRIGQRLPSELQPLADDLNALLERNEELVSRARAHAGNLAHALKTPLAAMVQGAAAAEGNARAASELPALVQEQAASARRHVDWHLARSRAAAAQARPGASVALAPVVAALVRVMQRVHAARALRIAGDAVDAQCAFNGESEDLHEMLGNLLDNACHWARSEVRIAANRVVEGSAAALKIVVEDDGPGIAAARRDLVLARGTRLDESVPGSGLGLAITQELVGLYGGRLTLDASALGGLRVELRFPVSAARRA